MFKKNIKPILMAGALALATAVSPVFAADTADKETITVTKDLNVANGNNTINETFKYSVTPVKYYTYSNEDGSPGDPTNYNNENNANNNTLYFPTVTTNNTLNVVLPKTDQTADPVSDITFTVNTKTIPGVYEYTIKETKNDGSDLPSTGIVTPENSNKKYIYDTSVYTVYVTVVDKNGVMDISNVQIQKGNNSGKNDVLKFTNTLAEDKANALSVRKEVTGDYGDKTKEFTFTGTITLPTYIVNDASSYSGTKHKVGGSTETVTIGTGGAVRFNLKHGEYVDFGTLPIGTAYTFYENEAGQGGYTTTISGADDGNVSTGTATSASEATGKVTDTTGDLDQVTFTNTKNGAINTGVIVNNMPYIALLGASGAGLVVLAASKKRSKK